MIQSSYIRNAGIRDDANTLLAQYPTYENELIKKRYLTFHDEKGNTYKRNEIPHFALTSELLYWMTREGKKIFQWWDVCDIILGYWVYNISTGNVWPTAKDEILSYIQSRLPVEEWKITNALDMLINHQADISYGAYLANPSRIIPIKKNAENRNVQNAVYTTSTNEAQPEALSENGNSGSSFAPALIALAAGALLLGRKKKKR